MYEQISDILTQTTDKSSNKQFSEFYNMKIGMVMLQITEMFRNLDEEKRKNIYSVRIL